TVAQLAATETIERDLFPALKAWDGLLNDLKALNSSLRLAGLPVLDPHRKSRKGEHAGHQE
ncbi:MAG TPA: hypothetical protein VFB95_02990, partial [Candidatus Cryosericum sp.]|nr:hypothetical protein [Candidatus Cryosericum sp.]